MTLAQKEMIEKELTDILKNKHSDINTGVDYIEKEGQIKITFFWDRISNTNYNKIKTFKCSVNDYPEIIETSILPYFN